jgi:hypothetical protein
LLQSNNELNRPVKLDGTNSEIDILDLPNNVPTSIINASLNEQTITAAFTNCTSINYMPVTSAPLVEVPFGNGLYLHRAGTTLIILAMPPATITI